jgi:DNA-binding NarL/FixJ family response regulator
VSLTQLPADSPVRVFVADPHAAVRDGLPGLLRPDAIVTVDVSATAEGVEEMIERHRPDAVLAASALCVLEGVSLPARLARCGLHTPVVIYAPGDGPEHITAAVNAGAAGIVGQGRPVAQVARALRTVAAGGMWFGERDWSDAPLTAGAGAALRRSDGLSVGERRVLALVAAGHDTDDIAASLSVSPHTVRSHVRNLMRKLDAQSRAHAVAIVMREQPLPLSA